MLPNGLEISFENCELINFPTSLFVRGAYALSALLSVIRGIVVSPRKCLTGGALFRTCLRFLKPSVLSLVFLVQSQLHSVFGFQSFWLPCLPCVE